MVKNGHVLHSDETRAHKLIRSVVRVTRRYHVLDRISRRLRRLSHAEGEDDGDSGGDSYCAVHGPCGAGLNASDLTGVDYNKNTTSCQQCTATNASSNSGVAAANSASARTTTRSSKRQSWYLRHTRRGPTPPPRVNRKQRLEKQVLHQQTEICSLREVIEDLRGSLQLSDAQNLALQVLLKKMARMQVALPAVGGGSTEFQSAMEESEKQLENLVRELKEMSQTKYPTMSSNVYADSSCSFNGTLQQDIGLDEDLTNTVETLNNAHR